jgi:hypothetical protein
MSTYHILHQNNDENVYHQYNEDDNSVLPLPTYSNREIQINKIGFDRDIKRIMSRESIEFLLKRKILNHEEIIKEKKEEKYIIQVENSEQIELTMNDIEQYLEEIYKKNQTLLHEMNDIIHPIIIPNTLTDSLIDEK